MPSYVVESYSSNAAVEDARARARLTAELGQDVRYVRTTFLLDDEMLFHSFEAPSAEALRSAASLAALHYERIIETVEGTAEPRKEEQ